MTKAAPIFIHFTFYVTFFLLLTHANSQTQEQRILLNLKQFWGNPKSLRHWIPTNFSSHCSWTEITCSNDSIIGLSFRDYNINGTVPPFICNLKNLTTFDVYNNSFHSTEFPRALYNCSKLEILDLSQNYFYGAIPDDIHRMSRLRELSLEGNNFNGNISASIGQLTELKKLVLAQCSFTGSFPPEIGNLSNLEELGLAYNSKMVPTLPSEFGKLKKLKLLRMTGTNLIGEIPNTIGDMAALEYLDLSQNNLTGKIPDSLFMPKNLKIVYLYKNKLSGEIPRVVEAFNLDVIDLSENNLIGTIPGDFGKLKNLTGLAYSTIQHANIVKLLCCISNDNSKLLVYEYLDNRSLDCWLHRKSRATTFSSVVSHVVLDWPKRLHIAVGVAQGLSYMHHDYSQPIVHRDVKSSNILLDLNFNAQIADFGLAKMLVKEGEPATMSAVAGTFGYIAPEYACTTRINEKIDVYSFGVILLELTTGRKANDGDEHTSLAEWALRHIQDGKPIGDALDAEVKEPCHLNEMCHVFKLALYCTSTQPSTRPSMKMVLKVLLQCSQPVRNKEKNATSEMFFPS